MVEVLERFDHRPEFPRSLSPMAHGAVRVCDRVCVCVRVYWYRQVLIDILKLIGLQQNLASLKKRV